MRAELAGQINIFGEETEQDAEYTAFVDKFKPKKTTDDCYTPKNIYEAVAEWVSSEYGVNRADMVRPFWPGGDFEHYEYPAGCCVVDNPPFSILTQIMRWYLGRGIRFFLFAPMLTLFSSMGLDVSHVACGAKITYENGANINTSFVTNLDTCRVRSVPKLYKMIERENDINVKAMHKKLPKYKYPDHVLTASAVYQYSRLGVEYRLEKADCTPISAMDAQRNVGKKIFGNGFLLSDKAAADRAAADKAAAEKTNVVVWQLSDRERTMIDALENRRPGG